jgi:poly-gamma-glutamate synthesis protein (capsule biosynthesis protein)
MTKAKYILQIMIIISILLSGCTGETPVVVPTETEQPFVEFITPTPQIVTDENTDLCIVQQLPQGFSSKLSTDNEITQCTVKPAAIQLEIGSAQIVSEWIYALAAPYFTIDDNIGANLLKQAWLQGSQSGVMISHLMVDQSTYDVFSSLWGVPDAEFVLITTYDEMKSTAKEDVTNWAIIPFEQIEPVWKIITIDDQSPLRKDFKSENYALKAPISLSFTAIDPTITVESLVTKLDIPSTNRDASKLATVLLTGVTALVRGTADVMEKKGMTYPADEIRPWFLEADIVHISNEIPFAINCPPPFPRSDELVFCSKPEYIELLESISTDVVEISGDHFQDWGPEATLYTIDMYNEEGWKYYGGGVNLTDGLKPLKLEVNGNKIAFIGCNAKGGGYAGASDTHPGAAECDFDYMTDQIRQLREEGYLPIITFQHLEYYSYKAHPILVDDFHKVSDAGAVIVSGSQAHQPHAIEFYNGSFLHYGLGNLFFDQLNETPDTDKAFIDRHVFYDGKYLGTELLTIQFIDLAKSRPMTIEERQLLLYNVFKESKY